MTQKQREGNQRRTIAMQEGQKLVDVLDERRVCYSECDGPHYTFSHGSTLTSTLEHSLDSRGKVN